MNGCQKWIECSLNGKMKKWKSLNLCKIQMYFSLSCIWLLGPAMSSYEHQAHLYDLFLFFYTCFQEWLWV